MRKEELSSQLIIAAAQKKGERDYWLKKLSGEWVKGSLPYDIKTGEPGRRFRTVDIKFPGHLFSRLMKLSTGSDVKLHILLAAAVLVLIDKYAYNQTNDIIVGTTIQKQNTTGTFTNTVLPLRNQINGNLTFKELVFQVRETIVEAIQNQSYPMDVLLDELNLPSPGPGFPLFEIAILLENIHDKTYLRDTSPNVVFSFLRTDICVKGSLEYNTSLYRQTTIKRLISHFTHLVQEIVDHSDSRLLGFSLLNEAEKKQILVDFNSNPVDYPKDKTTHELFEEQVEQTPDNNAVLFKDKHLTYQMLNKRANQLARLLRRQGMNQGNNIGLMVSRSLDMIIGILAILKAEGSYLPIEPDYPVKRINYMLDDSKTGILLTKSDIINRFSFTGLQNLRSAKADPRVTDRRPQITDLDRLPFPGRSMINYEKYRKYIGVAPVKNNISILATRGCPYKCAYCHKIWPKKHIVRSPENVFEEVQIFYNLGIRRFTIIDDIFNLNARNSSKFFQLIIENGMDIQLFFPNGLRGDILTPGYIDLMVKAGTRGMALALESASPRIQKLIKKNLNLKKLRENIDYICNQHPHVILEFQTMMGFPTETEEEAAMTLDFIKRSKWLHFPYLHILKIYQNTDMAKLAMENGVSLESIIESENLAYHELPGTLFVSKTFALKFQSDFLNDYFLLKERLLQVLPHQMKILSGDEMVQKYNSYLPVDIYSMDDLLQFLGITRDELPGVLLLKEEDHNVAPHINEKLKQAFPVKTAGENALNILLLDLSQYFSGDMDMLYEVVEVPLGLMYLLTYLQEQFGNRINGKIAKSRIDFDNYLELKVLIDEFKPDVIGIRTLTLYKDFFHRTVTMIRQWGIKVPIIAGGPYATSDYESLLQDQNVDLVVLGEGEITFNELIGKMIENQGKLPMVDMLKDIMGLAFIPDRKNKANRFSREVIMLDEVDKILSAEAEENLTCSSAPTDLAYTLFTSGSTGKPKGVMIEHQSINNLAAGLNKRIYRHYPGGHNVGMLAPYVFDASVQQIFAVLLLGHCLHIVPEDIRIDGSRLIEFYKRQQISISDGTPTHIRLVVESVGETPLELNLKHLVIGGEALPRALVEQFFSGFAKNPPKITNIYGVTECCVDSTSYEISPGNIRNFDCVPIGTPMPNQQIYILNRENQLQPVGIMGELCISGDGLARGYLNQPELTARRFCLRRPEGRCMAHSALRTPPRKNFLLKVLKVPGKRIHGYHRSYRSYKSYILYKTGDLARWLSDGNIEFLGRQDHQVKIRGFRIELGEIENQLMNYKKNKNLKNMLHKDVTRMVDSNKNTRCAVCLLPAGYPDLRLDEQGVCHYCHSFENEREKTKKYFKSIKEFRELMDRAKETKGSQYDCLLLYSGGKDSTYVLYRMVELGFKVLAFTFDNGYISQTAFENIKRTTGRLNVDSIVCTAKNMDRIFLQSLNDDDTVCTGCFKALTTLSTQLAYKKGINVVITGLSRGQIFDTKLHGLFQQGIFDTQEIEGNLLTSRKIYHSINDGISKRLNIRLPEEVFNTIHFVDFFRYEEVSANQVKDYLKRKDTYWQQPKDTGFCSTNCMINDVGIYIHLKNRGYHNYAAPLSWDCRLGFLERSEGLKEIRFDVNMEWVEHILKQLGYFTGQINDAVVMVREDKTGENALYAYFAANSQLDIRELKEYLQERLPGYMVPNYLIQLDRMPLTPNGKLDRKALPMPGFPVITRENEHAAPRDDLEEKLAGIWSEVLGIEKGGISIDSNFFELGGHSLKATVFISRLHKELGVNIPLSEIFKAPSIRGAAEFIKQGGEFRYQTIESVEKKEYYPLSSAQRRLFVLQQMDEQGIGYNMSSVWQVEGHVEVEKFEAVLQRLSQRHESLRTWFTLVNEEPVQRINEEVEVKVKVMGRGEGRVEGWKGRRVEEKEAPFGQILNASGGHSPKSQEPRAKSYICSFIRPFDLSQAPLLRVGLIRIHKQKYILMVDLHHIISDGLSIGIIVKEFTELYGGKNLPRLRLQYRDYSEWHNRPEGRGFLKKQETYWLKQFEGEIPVLDLAVDYPRPSTQGFVGRTLQFEMNKEETVALKSLAREQYITLFILLLSVYSVFLCRLSGQEDIVVGTPIAGRRYADLEPIIGMFVNTLALRNFPVMEKTFDQFLGEIKENTIKAFENQDYLYEDLVEQVAVERDTGRNPLFDTMFVLQNMDTPGMRIPELKIMPYPFESRTSKFDLTLTAVEIEDRLAFTFEYCTNLFKEETIRRFSGFFKRTVSAVLENHETRLSGIEIITPEDKNRVLLDFNDKGAEYPRDKTIHQLFAEQVERTPDGIAVVGSWQLAVGKGEKTGEKVQLTYGELKRKSDQVAHWLREKGVQPDIIVGIMVERSIEIIIGILGILKAGCAYLPIDPGYPEERISYMLADSSAAFLLTAYELSDICRGTACCSPTIAPVAYNLHRSLAYIIYTSGTTGQPKGVMVECRNVVSLLFHEKFPFDFNGRDVWTMFHSHCFDFSVWEIFGALLLGGTLIVIAEIVSRDTEQFVSLVHRHGVTILNQTPSVFYRFIDVELQREIQDLQLRYVIFGGEALHPGKLKRWRRRYPGVRLINMFGITETTVHVTIKEIGDEEIEQNIGNIGKAIPVLTAYVMDEVGKLKPMGLDGELYVGGAGVSRGYLNRPELTGKRYVENPYKTGERLYRSGDRVHFLENGEMVYSGRLDHQVQIRGFRVESGEIENRILKCEGVKKALVVDRQDETGDIYLCAYIVSDGKIEPAAIRRKLAKTLPEYMIPAYVVKIKEIPLTPNGKVDRNSLPEPEEVSSEKYAAPRDEIEVKLVEIWSEVLSRDQAVGIDDNFFDMGGHSLKATILVSKIHKVFDVKVPLAEIFMAPRIRDIAAKIKQTQKETFIAVEPTEKKEYYLLSPAQKRLFFLQQLVPGTTGYNIPNVIPLTENIDLVKLDLVFKELLTRHESLRTSIEMIGEEPVQRIHEQVDFFIDYYDTVEIGVESAVDNFVRPFDLDRAPLVRAGLVTIEKSRQIVVVDMHHIITDGTSQKVLEKDFMTFWAGEDLPTLRLQYRDYSEWLNRKEQRQWIEQQKAYWLREFAHPPSVLNVPADYSRPLMQGFAGNMVTFKLNAEETKILKNIVNENHITLYMCLLAVFNILFSKLSGQEDITFGTPIAARRHADLELIIGMLVNTLPMRNYPSAGKTFHAFLKEVKGRTLEAYENQEYPFEELVENIFLNRDTSRNPIFDILLNLMNQSEWPSQSWNSLDQPPYEHKKRTSRYDMGFSAVDAGENIYVHLEYSTNLYTPATIERFITYLKNIISSLPFNMEKRLADIELLTWEEKQQILQDLSCGMKRPGQVNQTIQGWFQQKAAEFPGKIALVFEQRHLTYMELNQKANQLALLLREKGIRPNIIVGLMIERSLEMIIAVLAVLKAGGAYLPIDPGYPKERILFMLEDSGTPVVLTTENIIKRSSIDLLKKVNTYQPGIVPIVTPPRKPVHDLDSLPIPDRSLVNYKKYHKYISSAMAKHTVSILTSRGCPFRCIYCNKVFTGRYVSRSAENIFAEIKNCYEAGIRRFAFIDDVFNLDEKNASMVLNQLIKNRMDVQLFFSNGLRGDILTREFIDLMIEAGTVTICLALESASPRIQKLIRKNLNLEKFRENVCYITQKYPQIILEMELMHGFPTETESEAMMTLDFLMDLKWVHFPDLHILKIYPHTNMYKLAVNHDVSEKQIARSVNLAYHQIPETLPFSKDFTRNYQARFLNEYFFLKERLQQVLPYQVKALSEDELVQKYDSYLPMEIKCFPDILEFTGLSMEELGDAELLQDDHMGVPDFSREIARYFPKKKKKADAFRVLLLDLSLSFTSESSDMLYDVVEAPLGLMYLLTYLNEKFGERVCGKILKSRIDFDSFAEMRRLVMDFKPDLIGIRTLSLYKDFFHRSVLLIRQWGIGASIVGGGPYATTEFTTMLQDENVDMAVLGEGELILADFIERMIVNGNRFPNDEILKQINGAAFVKKKDKLLMEQVNRKWILLDNLNHQLAQQPDNNLNPINTSSDMAYVIYTSGSTGKPKGVMLEHRNLVNLFDFQFNYTNIDCSKILQFATISFDASFHEIFSAFLSGGQLYLVDKEIQADICDLFNLIARHKIKTVFLPMSFLRLVFSEKDYINIIPRCIRHIQTAGEQVMIGDNFMRYLRDNDVYLHNHYGPSETHVVTTFTIEPCGEIPQYPSIGRPILDTTIYILDKGMHLVPVGVTGELYIGGIQVGRGYLNNPELTAEKFIGQVIGADGRCRWEKNEKLLWGVQGGGFLKKCPPGRRRQKTYKTGDLVRWQPDGNIEFLGRIDYQVKIRGFRVELGEIESQLLKHRGIKEVLVIARTDEKGDKYLCAYIVSDVEPQTSELREYLSLALPNYMIPSYFVLLKKIPLTPAGKIERAGLPAPGLKTGENYAPPRNGVEKALVESWSELLAIEKNMISIDANFFELGGQSLKATIMIAKVHKNFHVKLPLAEIFKTPTVRGLSRYIKTLIRDKYVSMEPVEQKEYYHLSSTQRRLYFLQRMDPGNKSYNIPITLLLEGEIGKGRVREMYRQLNRRHESFRTSFHMVNEEPVQRIPREVDFEVEYHEAEESSEQFKKILKSIDCEFDLGHAPLFKVWLIKVGPGKHILVNSFHHIIIDGVSLGIMVDELMAIYKGEQLPPLKIQYKDFAAWQSRKSQQEALKKQEAYWLREFSAELPLLNLHTDYERPEIFSFEGDKVNFKIDTAQTRSLNKLALEEGATLYMVLLAVYTLFLSKITGQEDIIVGTSVTYRQHENLLNVIGMFVNALAMRNYPTSGKTFLQFLREVKKRTLEAFNNQDYQFEDLVHKVIDVPDHSRNPIFDVMFVLNNEEIPQIELPGLKLTPYQYDEFSAQMDLKLRGREMDCEIRFSLEYATKLLKKETIEMYITNFKEVISAVLEEPGLQLKDINISHGLLSMESAILEEEQGDFVF